MHAGPTLTGTEPALGPGEAPITVLEFSDIQCPFCATTTSTLIELAEARSDLRVVHKDYPLSSVCNPNVHRDLHPNACAAAVAARCAGQQGRYWELLSLLLENQDQLDAAGIGVMAEQTGLKMKAFNACRVGTTPMEAFRADISAGEQLGVEGTPTVLVHGLYGDTWVMLGGQAEDLRQLLALHDAGRPLPTPTTRPSSAD